MRDDFSKRTIDELAKRAGYQCSNPNCGMQTVGATRGDQGFVIVGVAAHITAASPGGPRYDASLNSEERRHSSNGIWLCETHGKLVDSDTSHFTVEALREWKRQAEDNSFRNILFRPAASAPTVEPNAEERTSDAHLPSSLAAVVNAARTDLAAFKRTQLWPPHAIALNLRMPSGNGDGPFDASRLALALDTFNEMVIVAPPGSGKTTTLLQLVEACLSPGNLAAVFVPLSEWSSQPASLFDSIARRNGFVSTNAEQLRHVAESGRLALVLDGWNELDRLSRRRVHNDIRALKREFPDLRIVASTRRQALDVPLAGRVVEIDALSWQQQVALARALRGADGEALLDHAWRTPGVRELVAIPLYLNTLLARTTGQFLPTTREEILRLFIEEHEQRADAAEALREITFGLHQQMLTALAVEGTRSGNTTIAEARARAVLAHAAKELAARGQVTDVPQPLAVLDVLVSHHLIIRSAGGFAFQHQQFQEWYASLEVEAVIRSAAEDADARRAFRKNVLNERPWEECILFACERLSGGDALGRRAVSAAVLEALSVDPMLAATMVCRSSEAVWSEIREHVGSFARKWHSNGRVDRAAAFMIETGRDDFATEIWPLVSDPNDEVSLAALRCASRFRTSVLGPDAEKRLASLPDASRERVLSEIAMNSGMDGMQLAANVASADHNHAVRIAVLEALLFRRAGRLAADLLRDAPDEVWRTVAADGDYNGEITDNDVARRLGHERAVLIENETNLLRKLILLLSAGRDGVDVRGQVRELLESNAWPTNDDAASYGFSYARRQYPDEVTHALIQRARQGHIIPFWAEEIIQAANAAFDDDALRDLVMRPDTPHRIANAAAIVAGPSVVGEMINAILAIRTTLAAAAAGPDDGRWAEFHRLEQLLARTNEVAFVRAVLDRSATVVPEQIGLLASVLAKHGPRDSNGRAPRVSAVADQELVLSLTAWTDALLASSNPQRSHLVEVARAIGRAQSAQLVAPLRRLLDTDLSLWRAARGQYLAAPRQTPGANSDAYTSWNRQYGQAFAAIGNDDVTGLMIEYLRDSGYCGFGIQAAETLRSIWHARLSEEPAPMIGRLGRGGSIIPRRGDESHSSPFADAILAVVNELTEPGSNDEAQCHALELAPIAFSMPYGRRTEMIDRLLSLPQPPKRKRPLLVVLVEAGEMIPADLVFDGIHALAEEAKTRPWLLSEDNLPEWEEWVALTPFTDRPGDTLRALDLLPRRPEPRQTRDVLTALGRSPAQSAEEILRQLPSIDPRYIQERDWVDALERRGGVLAAQTLLTLVRQGTLPEDRSSWLDAPSLSRRLAVAVSQDSQFRNSVYQIYEEQPASPGHNIVESAIAQAADTPGLLLLLRDHARQDKRFSGELEMAVRKIAVGERPSETWKGAVEQFSLPVADLRRQLFMLVVGGATEAALAADCLTLIDNVHNELGAPEFEPRHPDIDIDRPWPLVSLNNAPSS